MYLGDNLLQGGIADLVAAFRAGRARCADPADAGARPRAVRRRRAAGRRASCGWSRSRPSRRPTWRWSASTCSRPAVHAAARAIEPSARGELEITDAIQHLVDDGMRVEPHIVKGWWKDTGRLEDMLAANRLVLETVEGRVEGELVDSQVDGRVVIEAGRELERSRRPRARRSSAPARALTDCYVGPYTAVGEGCVIENAEVEHSILLAARRSQPRRTDGVLAAGPQRQDRARPAPAARLPLPGRRQLRDRDPVATALRAASRPSRGDRVAVEVGNLDVPLGLDTGPRASCLGPVSSRAHRVAELAGLILELVQQPRATPRPRSSGTTYIFLISQRVSIEGA